MSPSGKKTPRYVIVLLLVTVTVCGSAWARQWFATRPQPPEFEENQPLANPLRLVSIELPAQIQTSDGSQHTIYGIRIVRPVDLSEALRHVHIPTPFELEIADPLAAASKVNYRAEIGYHCGTGLEPTYPPRRLPKYQASDLGTLLVVQGIALPTSELLTKDPAYCRQLLPLLGASARETDSQELRAEYRELGNHLVECFPEHSTVGLQLLRASRESMMAEHCRESIHRLCDLARQEQWSFESDELLDQLVMMIEAEHEAGMGEARRIYADREIKHPYLKDGIQRILAIGHK